MIDLRDDAVTSPADKTRTPKWTPDEGIALLTYDVVRKMEAPRAVVLEFLESNYQARAKRADWNVGDLTLRHLE